MNPVQRFFRRYIFSTIGILVLFLVVNLLLVLTVLVAGYMSGTDNGLSVREVSRHVTEQGGVWAGDDTALTLLQEHDAWAMLLDESGTVVWEQDLPEELPRSYTSAQVASFSRWYLQDYPVKVWSREDGALMVVGFAPDTLVKYYFSMEKPSLLNVPLPLGKIMFEEDHAVLEEVKAFLQSQPWAGEYEIFFSDRTLLEVTARGATKGGMVARLAERLGISRQHVYCAGDEANDLSMLTWAAEGFAPANCVPAVRACGATIVADADHDTLADIVSRLDKMYA